MKRLLVIAGDRALTRFVAEAMLGRSPALGPSPTDEWDVARAHNGLEGHLLLVKGGRPFDALIVDDRLPDGEVLELLDRIRSAEEGRDLPIFMMSERGTNPHARRIASERFGVKGFIEKPVGAESVRSALEHLERRWRILLVERDREVAERYRDLLSRAGYRIEIVERGRDAFDRAARYRPDLVISALLLDDMRGTDVCVELKKGRLEGLPIVLYGQISQLGTQEIRENAHRADDFIQAPFDDELLVARVKSLVGSAGKGPAPTPPPAPLHRTAMRATRRVPCHLSMAIQNGNHRYESKTLDISEGGIFLATGVAHPVGTLIDMTFQFPGTPKVVAAVGKVAWIERAPNAHLGGSATAGVGVKFSRIDPTDLQLIVDYVNRVAKVVYSA